MIDNENVSLIDTNILIYAYDKDENEKDFKKIPWLTVINPFNK